MTSASKLAMVLVAALTIAQQPVSAADAPQSFAVNETPAAVPDIRFEDGGGKPRTLADFRGKVVLLNIWATWCPPCVREMPTLDKLQKQLGSKDFAVVPLSVDKGGIYTVKSFYDDNFIGNLPIYVDPTTRALDTLSILGTPTTILIDKQGKEVARTMGPEDWDQAAVIAQIKHYMVAPAGAHIKPQQQARAIETRDAHLTTASIKQNQPE